MDMYLVTALRDERWVPKVERFHCIRELISFLKEQEYRREVDQDEYDNKKKSFTTYCDGAERTYTFLGISFSDFKAIQRRMDINGDYDGDSD